jgi:isopenicillin N synthase-like dioxygenase
MTAMVGKAQIVRAGVAQEDQMIIYSLPQQPKSIPVVDLTGAGGATAAQAKSVASAIHRACRETGFFYVANHGVPQPLVDTQFEWAKRLFDLPAEQKRAMHMNRSPSTAGYEPIGGQRLDSQDAGAEVAPPDLKESFYCGMELPDDHPLAQHRLRGFGHNQWPANMPGFREQMLAYRKAMNELGDRLLSLLATSLELPADWFVPFFDMPVAILRLIKYPPHPANAAANQIGAGAHTDWGGVTLLAQDDVGGLEVRNATGDWIQAPPLRGTFVINLGDLMARWTNGIYNSNMHRVKNNSSGRDRYSVPYFYSPRPDALIEPMPGCVTDEYPRRFASCTAAEHMTEMFRRSYAAA